MHMRISLALAAMALVLSACGGGSSPAVASSAGQPTVDDTDAAAPADPSAPIEDGSESQPASDEADSAAAGPGVESGPDADASGPDESASPEQAAETAAANESNLTVADQPTDTEVLVVADGSVTTLQQAVTGDRPVLLWFWAPH